MAFQPQSPDRVVGHRLPLIRRQRLWGLTSFVLGKREAPVEHRRRHRWPHPRDLLHGHYGVLKVQIVFRGPKMQDAILPRFAIGGQVIPDADESRSDSGSLVARGLATALECHHRALPRSLLNPPLVTTRVHRSRSSALSTHRVTSVGLSEGRAGDGAFKTVVLFLPPKAASSSSEIMWKNCGKINSTCGNHVENQSHQRHHS